MASSSSNSKNYPGSTQSADSSSRSEDSAVGPSGSHRHRPSHPSSSLSSTSGIIRTETGWFQRKINLRPAHRGCHLITDEILKQIPEISQFQVGIIHLHIMHTSASLTLNENWDPDVRKDMEMFLTSFVPEDMPFRHVCEGPDDMPAHVKACFLGSSLSLPITEGQLSLGTWQGIWLCEHRNSAGSRKITVTINGALKPTALENQAINSRASTSNHHHHHHKSNHKPSTH